MIVITAEDRVIGYYSEAEWVIASSTPVLPGSRVFRIPDQTATSSLLRQPACFAAEVKQVENMPDERVVVCTAEATPPMSLAEVQAIATEEIA